MISGKRESEEGVEQLNQQSNGTLGEKEKCKYLRILEENIKQVEMQEK